MRLETIHYRHWPPAVVLEFDVDGQRMYHDLYLDSFLIKNQYMIMRDITHKFPCITEKCRHRLYNALQKVESNLTYRYYRTNREYSHIYPIRSIAIDMNGERLLTGSYDQTMKLWNTRSGNVIMEFVGHSDAVCHVEFNKNGDRAITCSFDNTIRLWDCNTGQTLCGYLGHNGAVVRTKYFNNEEKILSSSLDNTLKIFQVNTGQEISTLLGHNDNISTFEINEMEDFIVTGSFDKTLHVWDPRTATCMQSLIGHEAEVSRCKILQNNVVVSTSFDRTCKIWDIRNPICMHTFVGHTKEVVDMCYSPARGNIVTCGNDGKAIIWDCQRNFQKLGEMTCNDIPITLVKYSPLKNNILTCVKDNSVRIWNGTTFQCVEVLKHINDVSYATFNAKEDKIVTSSLQTCFIWQCYLD